MKLSEFNKAVLRFIDDIVTSKTVTIIGWLSLSYIFIDAYLNNFTFFIFGVKLFIAGLLMVLFVVFGIPIIWLIFVIFKTVLSFGYAFIKYKLGCEN